MSGFIAVADPHYGTTTHDDVDTDGSPSWRQNEARRVTQFITRTSQELDAPIICLGDLFHSVRPQAWAYVDAALLDPDYTIPGNHDWPVGEGVTSPLAMLNGRVVDRPDVVQLNGIDVAFLPWFSRANVAAQYPDLAVADQHRFMAEATERIVAELCSRKRDGVPLVLVCHLTVGGATWNSGVQPQLGESTDFMVPRSVLDRPEFACVLAGHIHKPQEIKGDFTRIVYVGAPIYNDFGEEGNVARILHVVPECGGVTLEEIPTPAVEFVTVNLDRDLSCEDFAGKVVRIVGDAPAGEATAARIVALTEHIYSCKALHVSKPAVKFTRHEAREVRLIAVDASTDDALTEFAGLVGGEYAAKLPELLEVQHELERKAIA